MKDTRKKLRTLVADQFKPSDFVDYKSFLAALYKAMNEDSKYSYVQFAEDCGFKPTNIMYQYMQGVRRLTLKAGKEIEKALGLKKAERRYFEQMVVLAGATSGEARDSALTKMRFIKDGKLDSSREKDQLQFLGEWYHPVILEMISLPDFDHSPEWIVDNIVPKIKVDEAKRSLELLLDLDLIRLEGNTYQTTGKSMNTGHRVRSLAFSSYHQNMLKISQESLANVEATQRNISAVTVSVDEDGYKEIKQLIHDFNEKVMQLAEKQKENDRIYQMNIQLFPFRCPKPKRKKKKESRT
ncbi:MAG: TIGR02147 family protein [Pseudobacteriovorax sp.]|nr:TIGR02147 family protein [Pseudobacteriovorax sp.]